MGVSGRIVKATGQVRRFSKDAFFLLAI